MSITEGDKTLDFKGGPLEKREGISLDNPHEINSERDHERHREAINSIIDNLQFNLFDPLSKNFPGLAIANHPFSLPDQEGQEWTFTPVFFNKESRISSIYIEGSVTKPFQGHPGKTILVEGRVVLNRDSGWPLSENSSLLGFGTTDDKLTFLKDKVNEVMKPIESANEVKSDNSL